LIRKHVFARLLGATLKRYAQLLPDTFLYSRNSELLSVMRFPPGFIRMEKLLIKTAEPQRLIQIKKHFLICGETFFPWL